ncbi:MAG: alpha/beta hydrolase, partial [Candidatus Electrothrix sp. AUS1_2]|nr:alpha/beta hydrolase [Candidatus Electrothrix sp. AUS1_2]
RDIPLQPDHPSWDTLSRVEASLYRLADKPMLICWGGRDFCFNDRFYTEWCRRFPAAQCHYFPEAGHYVLEDALPGVLEQVHPFLAGCYAEA